MNNKKYKFEAVEYKGEILTKPTVNKVIKVDLVYFMLALNEHVENGNKITDFKDASEVIEIYTESNEYTEYLFDSEEDKKTVERILNEFISFHKER